MKKIIIATLVVVNAVAFANTNEKLTSPKKVCVKVYDSKQKKDVEKCKKLKIHKKHDGISVPIK